MDLFIFYFHIFFPFIFFMVQPLAKFSILNFYIRLPTRENEFSSQFSLFLLFTRNAFTILMQVSFMHIFFLLSTLSRLRSELPVGKKILFSSFTKVFFCLPFESQFRKKSKLWGEWRKFFPIHLWSMNESYKYVRNENFWC